MSNEKTQAQTEADAAEQHPAMGIFSYAVGGVIGLVILVGLASVLEGGKQSSNRAVEELPHLAILVEFDDFTDDATRSPNAHCSSDSWHF